MMDDAIINVFVSPNFLNEPVFRDENRVQRYDDSEVYLLRIDSPIFKVKLYGDSHLEFCLKILN